MRLGHLETKLSYGCRNSRTHCNDMCKVSGTGYYRKGGKIGIQYKKLVKICDSEIRAISNSEKIDGSFTGSKTLGSFLAAYLPHDAKQLFSHYMCPPILPWYIWVIWNSVSCYRSFTDVCYKQNILRCRRYIVRYTFVCATHVLFILTTLDKLIHTSLRNVFHSVKSNRERNYHNSGNYLSFWLLFKTRPFEDWIISPPSGGIYSVGSNK
jgi:hypothetical protein